MLILFSLMFYFKRHNVQDFVLERIIIDSVKLTYMSEKITGLFFFSCFFTSTYLYFYQENKIVSGMMWELF